MLQTIEDKIRAAAASYGVSPALALAVAQTESAGNPAALSPAGAGGVFQLMPKTAAAYGVADVFDASQNIDGGVRMLADLSAQYSGDLSSILAAYNWGSGNLASGRPMPAETVSYIAKIRGLLGISADTADTAAAADAALVSTDTGAGAGTLPDWALSLALGLGAGALVWLLVGMVPRRRG